MTLEQFIQSQTNLEFRCVKLLADPRDQGSAWAVGATHWQGVIRMVGQGKPREYAFFYSQGAAYTKPPTLRDCLLSLVLDAQGSNVAFDIWCDDLGYNDDRDAWQIYLACRRTDKGLRHVFQGAHGALMTASED